MSKLTKRLLCIALMILVIVSLSIFGFAEESQTSWEPECYEHGDVNGDGKVNNKDAIYILYSYMFGDDVYPIHQQWDYNNDSKADNRDAIYVMYHYMFEDLEDYKLLGLIHDYYDPSWVWDDATGTAKVTFKCGCGQPEIYTTGAGVTVTEGAKVEPTCVAAGSQSYTASVTVDGQEYTNTYVKILPAGDGHTMTGVQDCENDSVCSACGHTLAALGHSWTLENTVSATCTQDAYQTYRCSACKKTDTVVLEGTAGHSMQYDKDVQDGCKYTKWYQCVNCDHTAPGKTAEGEEEAYYKHTYTAALTKEATCVSTGVKTYTCADCNDSYTELVATNDSHNWVKGATVNNVTTHTCSDCQATKTTVEATKDTALSTDALKDNEVQLADNASVKLDEKTVDALEKDIKINVETVDPEEAGLTEAQQEQVGNGKVYDFTMTYDDGTDITEDGTKFAGEVTISLPYTLEEGEDVDSINVWFIDDDGKLTAVEATYSNGFVTFTTSHFSYYTVTRLTPAERCELYGHAMVTRNKDVTCTEDGYETALCQRCDYVEKDEVTKHTGHSFKKTVTAEATCEKAGAFEEVCGACGAKAVGTIPAIGHVMQKDDAQTVIADCEQAGKEVYVCQNNCGHTKEDVQPQLKHVYQIHEDTQPSCGTKGIYSKKCKLCDDIVVMEERLPIGHQFTQENVNWSWTEDNLSATVTLVCSHDSAHTKSLNAVVTETKKAASCAADGKITYTAVASYNDVSYTDSQTQTVSALGHTPDTKWQTNATQHYHSCSVCGEKVDATAHNWNEGTVLKAPTCAEGGEAVVQCLICQYETHKKLPATGDHNYVDGICSGCGREESDCFHLRTTETEMDLSAYNLCEGSWITKNSCDCGENVYYNWDLFCIFEGEEEETVIIDGEERTKYSYTCGDCGLVMESIGMRRAVPGECVEEQVEMITFLKGDQQIVSFDSVMGVWRHPSVTLVETVDLTDEKYGLCGGKLAFYVCGCEQQILRVERAEECYWIHEYYDYENRESKFVCQECGAVKIERYVWEEDIENCQGVDWTTYTYLVDDEEVYSVTVESPYESHSFEPVSYELFGDSCEDGVYVQMKCVFCDASGEDYTTWHGELVTEITDLKDAPICAEYMVTRKCPCGEVWSNEFVYPEDGRCQWEELPSTQENTSIYVCKTCGVTSTDVRKIEKDASCTEWVELTETYTDKNGNVIVVGGYREGELECHDYQITEAVLQDPNGDCEDGVQFTQTCTDCGDSYRGRQYGHGPHMQTTYDLASFGLCQDGIQVEQCLCGTYADYFWISNTGACNWQQIAGDHNGPDDWTETYRCIQCAAVYVRECSSGATDDPCRKEQTNTFTFYKNAEAEAPLQTVTYERYATSHDMRASFKLNDSELGCAGGYTVIETCQNCGHTETWSRPSDMYHEWYQIAKEQVSDGQLCNEIVKVTYGCACGAESSTEIRYEGELLCNWQYAGEENTYQCSRCQAVRTETYRQNKVPGTCQMVESWHYSYTRDGQELFNYATEHAGYSHRNVCTFQMNGTTCQEGYTIFYTCVDCGDTSQSNRGGCEAFPVERITAVDDENCCGVIELVHYQCPCGENDSWERHANCYWQYGGENKEGKRMYTCRDCGILWVHDTTETRIPGTCKSQVEIDDTYVVGDQTYLQQKTYTTTSHEEVATFTCLGDSCDDGYVITWKCQYCDYVSGTSGTNYGHETHRVAYYNLSDYGMCGGEVWNNSCACGQESNWGLSLGYCEQRHTGKNDPDTGKPEYFCQNCQLYTSWGEDGEVNHETCTFEGTFCFKLRNAEETLLYVQGENNHESHETRVVDAVLLTDGNCEGGIRLNWKCRYCDYAWTETRYEHYTYDSLYIETACDGYFFHRRCACGEEQRVEYHCRGMSGRYWEETDETGILHRYNEGECKACGLYVKNEWYDVLISGCDVQRTEIYTVRYGDQTQTVRYTEQGQIHEWGDAVCSLLPGAQTCEDGIMVTNTCKNCGYQSTWTESYHRTFITEQVDLAEKGACGGWLQMYRCACGEEKGYYLNREYCNYNGESWTETGADGVEYEYYESTCTKCGLNESRVWTVETTDEPCQFRSNITLTLTCGEYSVTAPRREYYGKHDYVTTFTLLPESKSCEDGVQGTNTCKVCGTSSSWTTYEHEYVLIEKTDLAEKGACGGELRIYRCPCGQVEDCDLDWMNCSTISNSWTETGADGVEYEHYERSCTECGLYRKEVCYLEPTDTTCQFLRHTTLTVTCGDYSVTKELCDPYTSHDYAEEVVTLQPGAQTCLDGMLVSRLCERCGYTESWTDSGHHRNYVVEYVDLTEKGACGAELYIRGCACGWERYYSLYRNDCSIESDSWTEIGADGFEYEHYEEKCSECGLYMKHVRRLEATDTPCQYRRYTALTVSCGEYNFTGELVDDCTEHDSVYNYVLLEGSVTCEDGVQVIVTCRNCDYQSGWTSSSHGTVVTESYDLTEYGAVCGGTLEKYVCACGQIVDMRLSEDLLCDLDEQSIDCWIEGDIDDYQNNIDSYGGAFSYAYLYRCAVTDPVSCPLTIRRATYWMLEDNCNAVQYEIWQLGYDEETGTCVRELKFATGEERSWHDYEVTSLDVLNADGSYVQSGTLLTCKLCQSTNKERFDYDENGNLIRREWSFVNTLDNGESKSYINVYTYEDVGTGRRECALDRRERIYADGSQEWHQNAYTYDLTNCVRICEYSDSNGSFGSYEDEYHGSVTWHEDVKQATCSQTGYYHEWSTCNGCGQIDYEYYDEYEPGHDWWWNDYEQKYVCSTCGMRNENGADGSVILEDLTDTYGNGEEYVIGYYKSEYIPYSIRISVVLNDLEADDNLIDLDITDITYKTTENDGYNGMSFNKAAADEAAKAAVASISGYEGTYAIRVTFIPLSGDDTLDYAITFDDVVAE